MSPPYPMSRSSSSRPGLSLVEVVLSTAIIGTLLASVLSVVGVAAQRSARAHEAERAAWLARDLMAEVASRPCAFRTSGLLFSGLDLDLDQGGVLTRDAPGAHPDRTAFNDIFDYDNWTSTPPVDVDGTAIPGFTGWTRNIDVDAVSPVTLTVRAFDDTCARIVVTISRNGRVMHTESLVRTQAMDTLREPVTSDGTIITELESLLGL